MECNPPAGMKIIADDWRVMRKNETNVIWDYEKRGPIKLTHNMFYDGNKLFNPYNGRTWDNIIEHLAEQVKEDYERMAACPGPTMAPWEGENGGFFFSMLLQQWYDIINVSTYPLPLVNGP